MYDGILGDTISFQRVLHLDVPPAEEVGDREENGAHSPHPEFGLRVLRAYQER